ncbi:hypothetical protein ACFYT4_34230 [Streptomyces sp. NPDC004609]|uniref:hypothetical protein n=1 Tax=Streptomyces sp. NPDC004609 TaxID=3364704 RepID=UPI00367D286C
MGAAHLAPLPEDRGRRLLLLPGLPERSEFLPIHRDTLARTRELQADATAVGRSRAAEVNERLAIAVEHVITRITDQEHDELSPAPNDAGASHEEGERTADAADNSAHLAEAAQRRRLACTERVPTVLDALERDGGAVTVGGAAARAGVSRTFLYGAAQAPLLARLRGVADKQPATGRPALPDQQRITTKSHETVVRAYGTLNRKLHEENERLRDEIAVALGQLRDLRRGIPVP